MGNRRRSRNGSLVAEVIGEHLKGPDVVAHQSPISIKTSYQCAYDIQTLKFELVINVVVELERHILLFVNCHLVVASFLQYKHVWEKVIFFLTGAAAHDQDLIGVQGHYAGIESTGEGILLYLHPLCTFSHQIEHLYRA